MMPWFQRLVSNHSANRTTPARRHARPSWGRVELLEDRVNPATLTYNAATNALTFTADAGQADDVTVRAPAANQVTIAVGNGDTITLAGDASSPTNGFIISPDGSVVTINTAISPLDDFNVNLGDQDDALDLSLVQTPNSVGNVTIDGGAGTDTLTVSGDVTITGDFAATVETANLNGDIAQGGTITAGADAVNVQSDAAQIQDAVNLAVAGATVTVAAGTYTEDVTVGKQLTLNGANAGIAAGVDAGTRGAESIVDGGFYITADNVTIDGFTIQNGGTSFPVPDQAGVVLANTVTGPTVQNNIISGPGAGPSSRGVLAIGGGTTGLTVRNNDIGNWTTGVFNNPATSAVVTGNNIHDNVAGVGNDSVTSVQITGNDFTNNGEAIGVSDSANVADGTADITASSNNFAGNTNTVDYYGGDPIDASGNWWGTTAPAAIQATMLDPTGVDFTPFLTSGTDTNPAAPGFQGDFSDLMVTVLGPQTGTVGRVQEAVNLATPGGTVHLPAATFTENVTITEAVTLSGAVDGSGNPATTLMAPGTSTAPLVTVTGAGFTAPLVRIENIACDGTPTTGTTADYGIRVNSSTRLDRLEVANSTFTGFDVLAVVVTGDTANGGISVANVALTDLQFTDNGVGGGGGSGDINLFQYNGDATLTNLTLSNSGNGARSALEFRGIGTGDGTQEQPMGNVSLTNVDISGKYATQFLGIQRYSDVSGLSLSGVKLGGPSSEITGSFGALLRFDAVGTGTVSNPATVDLGDTAFRGLANTSAQPTFIEFAPDNPFAFLRADATGASFNGTAAADLTLPELFDVEARIHDYPDLITAAPSLFFRGFAELRNGQAYVTATTSGGIGPDLIGRAAAVVDAGGTVHVADGTYTETNILLDRPVTIAGQSQAGAVVDASGGNGFMISSDGVTLRDLTVTGDGSTTAVTATGTGSETLTLDGVTLTNTAQALDLGGYATYDLTDVTLTGNADAGTVADGVVNLTPTTGDSADTITATGTSVQFTRDPTGADQQNQAIALNSVPQLNLFGAGGSDTFDITPAASGGTAVDVNGGPPDPSGGGGDVLNVDTSGASGTSLTVNSSATGLSGQYTFSDAAPVSFSRIESLAGQTVVTGMVFNDQNGNGTLDAGEPGLGGRQVFLDLNGNGTLDTGEPTATTAADGSFTLVTSATGPATVQAVAGSGFDRSGGGATVTLSSGGGVGGADVGLTASAPAEVGPSRRIAVGAIENGNAVVKFYGPDGQPQTTIPVPSEPTGSVPRVDVADVNGDGVADVIVGTGPGGSSLVRVVDGTTGQELFRAAPFEASFTGGVYVAAGDVTGDGVPDLVVTPDVGGGPRVLVYTGAGDGTFQQTASFFGIDDPNFRGGARAAVGDVSHDGRPDLVVAAGFGGGPRVAVFDGQTVASGNPTRLVNDFFVFPGPDAARLRNGAYLAVGDLNGDGYADIIGGAGPGGAPRVVALSGQDLMNGSPSPTLLVNFYAGDQQNRDGIRVATKDLNGNGRPDLVVGSGRGAGSRVTGYTGQTLEELFSLDAGTSTQGVFVG